jgi:hypothetical protein
MQEDTEKVIITLSMGHRVECLPVADLINSVGAHIPEPQPPTYTIESEISDPVEMPYDQAGIDDPSTPQEDKDAWRQYLIDHAVYEEKTKELRARFVALRGIKLLDPPEDESWVEEDEWAGLEVPSKPYARLVHFVDTRVIRTQKDGQDVFYGIAKASGTAQEVLDSIEDTFRNLLGQEDGAEPEEDTAEAT